jgi:hypothetical protein
MVSLQVAAEFKQPLYDLQLNEGSDKGQRKNDQYGRG